MVEILLAVNLAVLVLLVVLVLRGPKPVDLNPVIGRLENLDRAQERSERALQSDLATQRQEAAGYSSGLRTEVLGVLRLVNENAERNRDSMHRSITILFAIYCVVSVGPCMAREPSPRTVVENRFAAVRRHDVEAIEREAPIGGDDASPPPFPWRSLQRDRLPWR